MGQRPAPATKPDAAVSLGRQRDRVLVSSFLSGAVGRLLTPLFGALAVALAVRALGDTRYGVVATIGSGMGFLIFADLGVGNAFMTRLAAAYGRDDVDEMRRIVSTAWVMMNAAAGVVLAGGFVAGFLVPWQVVLGAPDLSRDEVRAGVVAFFVLVALTMPATLGQRVQMSLHRGASANTWAVAAAVLTPGAVALTDWWRLPLWCFVVSTVGVPVIVSIIQTAWVLCVTHAELRPTRRCVSGSMIRTLIGVGGLYLVLNVASAAAYQADSIIVAGIKGAAAAAVFSLALRLFRVVGGLAVNGSEQLWTVATAALATGDTGWLRSRFLKVVMATGGTIGLLCAILVVVGRPLISFWAGESLVPSYSLLVVFAVWTTYSAVLSQVVFLLNAADIVAPQVAMALSMAVVNVALSVWFTHEWGLVGPIVASLIAHFGCYGLPALLIARRILRPAPTSEGAQCPDPS